MIVQVFKWIQGHIFITLGLVDVFLVLCIFIRVTLVETLISHIFEFLANRASSMKSFIFTPIAVHAWTNVVRLRGRNASTSLEEASRIGTPTDL
mgnify:CR=1 FL=1